MQVRTDAPHLPAFEERALTVRTSDGAAVGAEQGDMSPSFTSPLPLGPAVDALAQWAFAFDDSGGHVHLKVAYERPKRYVTPAPAPGDTVLVTSVGGYSVTYAPGDACHLHLEAASTAERAFALQAGNFIYRDVWFDPVSYLPTRVALTAPGESFVLAYTIAEQHWLLAGFSYDGILDAQHEPKQAHHIDAEYAAYTFPRSVPAFER